MSDVISFSHPPLVVVSVLMPVHNTAAFLPYAIDSIIRQDYTHYELIICDDASTDDSWSIIQSYAKKDIRIKSLRNELNLGISKTRNRCLAHSHPDAQYIALMDSDDIALPQRLARQVQFLEQQSDMALVGSNIYIINEQGRRIGYRRYHALDIQKIKIIQSPFAQPSVMLRSQVIKQAGGYNEQLTVAEDLDLWLRILEKHSGANLPEFLLEYRISQTQSKNTQLRATLWASVRIKSRYLLSKKSLNPVAWVRIMSELALLLAPKRIVLYIFRKMTISTQ